MNDTNPSIRTLSSVELTRTTQFDARVMKLVSEQLDVPIGDVKPESKFIADLGADSIDTLELIMGLENEFHIEIADEDAEKIESVDQAMVYIASCRGAR